MVTGRQGAAGPSHPRQSSGSQHAAGICSAGQPSPGDKQQREHKQQQLAARLAQLPSSNGHSKADSTQQQQQRPEPQIPQQPTDADAVQAWQLRHDELTQLQQKGRAGGWLISTDEVSRAPAQHSTARRVTQQRSQHTSLLHTAATMTHRSHPGCSSPAV